MEGIINRITHWKSTGAGLIVVGGVWYIFQSFHCQLPNEWVPWVVAFLSGLPGVFAKG